jgi:hypothetical protein
MIFLALAVNRGPDSLTTHRGQCRGGRAMHARSPRTLRVRAALHATGEFPPGGPPQHRAERAGDEQLGQRRHFGGLQAADRGAAAPEGRRAGRPVGCAQRRGVVHAA